MWATKCAPIDGRRALSLGLRRGAVDWFRDVSDGFGQRLLLIRRVEVEINPAERTRPVVLAQDDSDTLVECDAVAEFRPPAFLSLGRIAHQGYQRGFKILGDFIDANHELFVSADRLFDFRPERFCGHKGHLRVSCGRSEAKSQRETGIAGRIHEPSNL